VPLSITRPDPASPSRRRAVMPDLLKSLAIFGVVYIHSGALAGQTAPISYTKALFRFGVPVFILIWAYFQERSYLGGRSWQSVVPQKFLALMIPFAVWSLMYFLLAADFSALTPASAVTRHWLGYGWAGQFFFIILFQLIVVFPLVRRIRLEAWSLVVLFLAFAALFVGVNALSWPDWFIKLGFRPFLYWLPYAFLGIYLARNPQRYLPLGAAAIGFLLIAANPLLLGPHPSLDGEY
jgi:surface polysaccharide O-acyltransferase-like enzyme